MTTERWWEKLPESLVNSGTILTMIDMLWVLETKLENRRKKRRAEWLENQKKLSANQGQLWSAGPLFTSDLPRIDSDQIAEQEEFEKEKMQPCGYRIEFSRPDPINPEFGISCSNTVIPIAVIADKAEAEELVQLLKAANPNMAEDASFSAVPIKAFPTAAETLAWLTFGKSNWLPS